MRSLLIRLFIENWQRKLISLILAMVIWMVVNHSMTVTKTIGNIPVRITHLPPGRTIEGMQSNGLLDRRVTLTLTGNMAALDDLSETDLCVEIDARTETEREWVAVIDKKNLVSDNPELHLDKMISRVAPVSLILHPSKLVSEKIPVLITDPIGEPPRGYQFLGCWPYQLFLTVHGPEPAVKQLKARGLKLTFNLNDISLDELETLLATKHKDDTDEVSFFVPNAWKKIYLPQISDTPLEIDDPQAKALRIDFAREDLLPIDFDLPVTVFFPAKTSQILNPEKCHLIASEFVENKNGLFVTHPRLFAQGVSRIFLETVRDMMQIAIVAAPKTEKEHLSWNVQFLYPQELEDRYVAKMMAEPNYKNGDLSNQLREEYLRSRFRSYMNRLRLYTDAKKKLHLEPELQEDKIVVHSKP